MKDDEEEIFAIDSTNDNLFLPSEEKDFNPGVYWFSQTTPDNFFERKIVFFGTDGNEIGVLDWNSDKMNFEGNAEESARIFFNCLIKQIEDGIK